MKTASFLPFLFAILFASSLSAQSNIQQTLSINPTGVAADASAQLDVSATDKGMLVPRMTTAQRTAIASPATGLLVFDTTTGGFWFYNSAAWVDLSGPKVLADADGDTKIQVEESPDEDIIRFDLGGTENMVLRKNTGGSPRLEFPGGKTFVGTNAGQANTTGFSNIAIGTNALYNNTVKSNLVAVGDSALYNNGTGATFAVHGTGNTALGSKALFTNTIGYNNTASGHWALFSNISGFANTAHGAFSLQNNTTGYANTALGTNTLVANTTGSGNTAAGNLALLTNTTGSSNSGFGIEALKFNTTGNNNTAAGVDALVGNTTGNNNTAAGYAALGSNKANSRSTAVGNFSMYYADDRTTGRETFNTAIGYEALKGSAPAANNTGRYNTAVGDQALFSNTDGFSNTAGGVQALFSNTTGSSNTANGQQALYSNTSGGGNTGDGYQALFANTTGGSNNANGYQALYSNTTGNNNNVQGAQALYFNTTGSDNTAQGYHALSTNASGSGNTAIGSGADVLSNNLDNATALGYNAKVGCTGCLVLGGTGADVVNVGIGTTTPAATLHVVGSLIATGITDEDNNTKVQVEANANEDIIRFDLGGIEFLKLTKNVNGFPRLELKNSGQNTFVGNDAGQANFVGTGNTAHGYNALYTNTIGSNNTAIGAGADVLSNNLDNASAIGYNAKVGTSNSLVLGGTGVDAVNVGIGTTTPTTAKLVISTTAGENGIDLSTADAYAEMRVIRNTLNAGDNDLYLGFGSPVGSATRIYSDGVETITVAEQRAGINRVPQTNELEVEGNASKSTAGDWLANSDARLKKNIQPLNSQLMLQSLLALRGVTYEWNDDKTGSKRPEGIQYGFTAQNIQTVFPTLVEEDKLGYLQTAYGTYDAMTVEAIRALKMENDELRTENAAMKAELHANKSQLDKITAALVGAGIAVEK